MKKSLPGHISAFILLIFFSGNIQGQDLIVIKENDSVNCKILRIKEDFIYFSYASRDKVRKTLVPLSQVSSYKYDFYPMPDVPYSRGPGYRELPSLRIGAYGGWSYRTAKLSDNIPSDFKRYMKDLKSGVHYGLDAVWYFSDQYGAGFKYATYTSKNSIDNVSVTMPDGSVRYGIMSDNISIQFAGALFSTRIFDEQMSNCLVSTIGLGYLGYTNNAVLIDDYTLKGSTAGIYFDIGYDIKISENFVLGFQAAYIAGVLSEFDYSDATGKKHIDLEEDQYEGLHRIDLSIGLRFTK